MESTGGLSRLRVNGEEKAFSSTLEQLLKREGYCISKVAVLRNGQVVSKSQFAQTALEHEDKIEIVSFVGGG